jgi:hypothetical protein
MDEFLFRSSSEAPKSSIGGKLAWWILAPFLGTISGLFFGAIIWLVFLISFSGEGLGVIGWALAGYLILAAWFFAIMGFSVGIAFAIHKTSNLTNKK